MKETKFNKDADLKSLRSIYDCAFISEAHRQFYKFHAEQQDFIHKTLMDGAKF